MKNLIVICGVVAVLLSGSVQANEVPALKDVYKDYFLIGGAYNRRVVMGQDPKAAEIAVEHFNTATSENDMKWSLIHPQSGQFNWAPADRFMEFCEQHNMAPIGHTLVWHSQVPRWVFTDDSGNTLTREALLARMKDHITAVAGRYKGRMLGWDVVNEALNDNGTLRNSQWLRIIGEGKPEQQYDFIAKAFEYAHAADPDAELYYNDYNLSTSRAKADGAAAIVRHLKSKGIRIDGVGMQVHAGLEWPSVDDLEYAIKTLSATGVKVMVTELDIRTRRRGPTGAEITQINRRTTDDPEAASPEVQQKLADKYAEIFSVLVKHKDVIPRVTLWGVYDATSWIGGSPLLFDNNYQPKQAFDAVVQVVRDRPQAVNVQANEVPALKDVYKDYFLIGGAYNRRVVMGQDPKAAEIAVEHFNTATSENDMKWSLIHPQPGQFNWAPADRFMEFCEQHNMAPIGHTLVWHSQVPRWVFTDDSGNTLAREALLARMKDHITAVAGRYKGRMLGWDVVNEALNDNGTLRNSQWLRIIGEGKPEQQYDFIAKAFEYAHAADPDAELYYNDYNLSTSRAKADGAAAIVRHLKSKGIRIDGVGMQVHAGLEWPSVDDLEYAIKTLSATGVKVMVTELDIRTRTRGPRGAEITQINRRTTDDPDAVSAEVQQKLADKYAEIFSVLVKHKDVIPRVTFWGVYDTTSWIGGSPLLFDGDYQPKQAFDAVVNVVREQQ